MHIAPRLFCSMPSRFVFFILALCFGVMWFSQVQAQTNLNNCGPLENHYGPFDYRTQRHLLVIVEKRHFTTIVETLISGSTGAVGQDIDYTLHTSPNHHRALIAVVRLGEKLKTPHPANMKYPVECYFDRALRFAPDDTVVRVLYSQFLIKKDRKTEAIFQLDSAVKYANDNPFSHFNIGLAFFDMQDYEKALVQAHRVAELGWDRPELVDLLKGVNKWQDPTN